MQIGETIDIAVCLESIGFPYRFGLPSIPSLLACASISSIEGGMVSHTGTGTIIRLVG